MKNIHLLPTNKPSRLFLNKVNNKLLIDNDCTLKEVLPSGLYQNIYITSDEEIKEGDWHFNLALNLVEKTTSFHNGLLCEKIILATDPQLIADGVQAISDEFLEWFVKNPTCEWVKVKEEDYSQKCRECGEPVKRGYSCNRGCFMKSGNFIPTDKNVKYKTIIPKEEPKQETPEEAAQKQWGNVHRTGVLGFIEGANWQAERMYSEEECYRTLHKLMMEIHLSGLVINDDMDLKKWFEQFKKK
jgi:hypothetical protein